MRYERSNLDIYVIGLLTFVVLLALFAIWNNSSEVDRLEDKIDTLSLDVAANQDFVERLNTVIDSQGTTLENQTERFNEIVNMVRELYGLEPIESS